MNNIENTSGLGKGVEVPAEIKKFNFGALFFNVIWGICNNTYISFYTLIPFFGVFFAIALGAKGNEWAWQNKKWDSVESFNKTQRKWNIAALSIFCTMIISTVLALFFLLPSLMKGEVYDMSLAKVKADQHVVEIVGNKIEQNTMVKGSIHSKNDEGYAKISYKISGNKQDAYVYATGLKKFNKWNLCDVWVIDDNSDEELRIHGPNPKCDNFDYTVNSIIRSDNNFYH